MTKYKVELVNQEPLVVQATMFDKIAFETYLRNNKQLGGIGENAFRMLTFTSWNAAKRAGLTTLTFDEFIEVCIEVTGIDDEPEGEDELGEPTPATHTAG